MNSSEKAETKSDLISDLKKSQILRICTIPPLILQQKVIAGIYLRMDCWRSHSISPVITLIVPIPETATESGFYIFR